MPDLTNSKNTNKQAMALADFKAAVPVLEWYVNPDIIHI
jgi:hypothetical protein